MELNQTQVVLLGMLARGHMTGYQIKASIDRSVRFFWNASVSAIYPELKRLTEAGLIDATRDGRRTTYALTDAGRGALHDWLIADQVPLYELRHEGMLRLFFADDLDDAEALQVVRRMREAHETKEAALRAVKPQAERSGGWAPIVRDFGEGWNGFVIDWCKRTEQRLAGGDA